ncbi:MAG TPA: D-alanine--D-alanine ligase family protein [Baekduia sp.]|nr:D-alanine--D-alanine ligase family protein [Baekduia sp.]
MRVAVLRGGRSSEHEVSMRSGGAVADALAAAGHDAVIVELNEDGTWCSAGDELALQPGRGLLGCDVAFPVLHGPFGEDGTVQGLLELLGIPYVGSGVMASAVCMDKVVFKDLMAQRGLEQVGYALVTAADEPPDLGYPCWVKPARLGSSVGIVRVAAPEDLPDALEQAFAHDPRVIVEAHSQGLEVEVSVLGHTEAPEVSTPGEIVLLSDSGWYDYETKYSDGGMRLEVPARISESVAERVRQMARDAFTAAGCSGLARVDFFVDGETVLLNEINTLPGFTPTSVYGALWAAEGFEFGALVERLCTIARERHQAEASFRF